MKSKRNTILQVASYQALLLILLCHKAIGAAPPAAAYKIANDPAPAFSGNPFQQNQVTGVVVDASGNPVPNVTIYFKSNPQKQFMANEAGVFTATLTQENDVLVFESVNYVKKEVKVSANSKIIKVTMDLKDKSMDEVVVIGYGTQERKKVTSSVSKLDGKKLESLPVNSVGDGLKGKVAGLRVYTTDNQPGENPTFRIRGGSSVNKSDAPIIIVDGIVRDLSGINPNDIESIEVLKDAAAAAIYGARASNGIVLITTKKGSNRKPSILFEASGAEQSPAQSFDLMNARDYLFYMRSAIAEGKFPARNFSNGFSTSSANTDASMWTPRYLGNGESVPEGWQSMTDPIDNSKTLIFQDVDYQKRFFRNSQWQNYYVGVNGGNDQVKYSASAGYVKDGGIGINTAYDRFTMRGLVDFRITDKLTFTGNYDMARTNLEDFPENKRDVVQRGLSTPNTHRLYNTVTGLPEKGYNGATPTPDWYDYYYDRGQITKRNTVSGKLKYQHSKDLSFTTMLTNFNRHTRGSSFIKANEYNGLRNTSESFSETQRLNWQAFGNYMKSIGDHDFDVTLGTEYMRDDLNGFDASVTGASTDNVPTLSAGSIPGNPTSSKTREVLISYFGRVNYSYLDRYLLGFTMRTDGSSKFSKTNRWGYFPGVSAGWIVSEEKFWKASDWFSTLKVRGSYGLTGNNAIGLFATGGSYSTSGKYNNAASIITNVMPNEALRWESTRQLDIGVNAGFLNNRIQFSVDYFNKITNDLLFDVPLPNTTGYATVEKNIGKVKFYGLDFQISSTNIRNKNFSWTTDFTYSYIMNKVLKLPENGRAGNRIGGILLPDGSGFGGIAEGERLYRIYGYVVDRILETQAEANAAMYDANSNGFSYTDGKTIAGRKNVGDYEWVNRPGSSLRNGEDQINSEDQFLLGYTIPHTTGGITNTFTYKNFTLNVFMDYALGHTVQNYLQERYFMGTFNYNYNLTNEVKKAWTKPGDKTPYAKFFANDADDGSRNYSRVQNVFSEKGDFLCLREVTLAYNLPAGLLQKAKIKNLTVYVSGNNLYYFTAVNGVSPERGTGSTYDTDYNPYPATRRMAAGIKLTL
ncbi:MAG: SusC/RagA family TonB-linked outer membrane protein [Pseudobacter sp.]|uniref:SusC/RagA family TonB-linked outer membrane protein n=1 Tax=Pseudobacter sp. TaxID=2045420 RepID=UPI003F7F94D8